MRDKYNRLLLAGSILSALVCVAVWNIDVVFAWYLSVAPFFCLQLLLCRTTHRWWMRAIPEVPVAALLVMAGFYLLRDSGWDRLAALVLGLAAIGPAAGCLLGWAAWGMPILRRRKKEKRQG